MSLHCCAFLYIFMLIFILYLLFSLYYLFFFNDTATTEIYTLSLHDALPICRLRRTSKTVRPADCLANLPSTWASRSEEHTSELQSLRHLVCRLLLEKKKKKKNSIIYHKNNVHTTLMFSTTYFEATCARCTQI